MHSTQYLYGIDAAELENKYYLEALQYKLESGTRLYRELMPYENTNKEKRHRMHYVYKAINHTKKLIEELSE